jgi:hypothetical protein
VQGNPPFEADYHAFRLANGKPLEWMHVRIGAVEYRTFVWGKRLRATPGQPTVEGPSLLPADAYALDFRLRCFKGQLLRWSPEAPRLVLADSPKELGLLTEVWPSASMPLHWPPPIVMSSPTAESVGRYFVT